MPHPSGFIFYDMTHTGAEEGWVAGPDGGIMAFNVPNWIDLETIKFLRLQVHYRGHTPDTEVFGINGVPGDSTGITVAL